MSPSATLALQLAPELAIGLFGSGAEATASAIEGAMRLVAGTADAASIEKALARDPALAPRLRMELARVAAAADRTERRAEMDALEQTQLAVAPSWAAPAISATVLIIFGTAICIVLVRGLPSGSESVMTMLLGTLAAMATGVVSYWVGSSAGSATKTNLLFRANQGVMSLGPRQPPT